MAGNAGNPDQRLRAVAARADANDFSAGAISARNMPECFGRRGLEATPA